MDLLVINEEQISGVMSSIARYASTMTSVSALISSASSCLPFSVDFSGVIGTANSIASNYSSLNSTIYSAVSEYKSLNDSLEFGLEKTVDEQLDVNQILKMGDGPLNPNLVKAYPSLYGDYLSVQQKELIRKELTKCGFNSDDVERVIKGEITSEELYKEIVNEYLNGNEERFKSFVQKTQLNGYYYSKEDTKKELEDKKQILDLISNDSSMKDIEEEKKKLDETIGNAVKQKDGNYTVVIDGEKVSFTEEEFEELKSTKATLDSVSENEEQIKKLDIEIKELQETLDDPNKKEFKYTSMEELDDGISKFKEKIKEKEIEIEKLNESIYEKDLDVIPDKDTTKSKLENKKVSEWFGLKNDSLEETGWSCVKVGNGKYSVMTSDKSTYKTYNSEEELMKDGFYVAADHRFSTEKYENVKENLVSLTKEKEELENELNNLEGIKTSINSVTDNTLKYGKYTMQPDFNEKSEYNEKDNLDYVFDNYDKNEFGNLFGKTGSKEYFGSICYGIINNGLSYEDSLVSNSKILKINNNDNLEDEESKYLYTFGLNVTNQNVNDKLNNIEKWAQVLNKDEYSSMKKIFNYICTTEGYEKGYDFLYSMSDDLDKVYIYDTQKKDYEYVTSTWYSSSVALLDSLFVKPIEALENSIRVARKTLSGEKVYDSDTYLSGDTYYASLSNMYNDINPLLGKTFSTMYAVDQMAISTYLAKGLGGGALASTTSSGLIYGGSTFTDAYQDAKNRNISDTNALAYAAFSASSHTLARAFSITKISGIEGTYNNLLQSGELTSQINNVIDSLNVPAEYQGIASKLLLTSYCMGTQGLTAAGTAATNVIIKSMGDVIINGDLSKYNIEFNNYKKLHPNCSDLQAYAAVTQNIYFKAAQAGASAIGPAAIVAGATMLASNPVEQKINFKEAFEKDPEPDLLKSLGTPDLNPNGGGITGGTSSGNTGGSSSGNPTGGGSIDSSPSGESSDNPNNGGSSSGSNEVIWVTAKPNNLEDELDDDLDYSQNKTAYAAHIEANGETTDEISDEINTTSEINSETIAEAIDNLAAESKGHYETVSQFVVDGNGEAQTIASSVWVPDSSSSTQSSIQQGFSLNNQNNNDIQESVEPNISTGNGVVVLEPTSDSNIQDAKETSTTSSDTPLNLYGHVETIEEAPKIRDGISYRMVPEIELPQTRDLPQKLTPNDIMMVHATDYLPTNKTILPASNNSDTGRNTVHFAGNGLVKGGFVGAGDWDNKKYVILEPGKYHADSSLKGGFLGDFYYDGPVELKNPSIMIRQKDFDKMTSDELKKIQGYDVYVTTGDNTKQNVANVIKSKGFRAMDTTLTPATGIEYIHDLDDPTKITSEQKELETKFTQMIGELNKNGITNARSRIIHASSSQQKRDDYLGTAATKLTAAHGKPFTGIGTEVKEISADDFLLLTGVKKGTKSQDLDDVHLSFVLDKMNNYGIGYNPTTKKFIIADKDEWKKINSDASIYGNKERATIAINGALDEYFRENPDEFVKDQQEELQKEIGSEFEIKNNSDGTVTVKVAKGVVSLDKDAEFTRDQFKLLKEKVKDVGVTYKIGDLYDGKVLKDSSKIEEELKTQLDEIATSIIKPSIIEVKPKEQDNIGSEVIDVSEIDTGRVNVGKLAKGVDPNVMNMSYEGYDLVFKSKGDAKETIEKTIKGPVDKKVLLELDNTIGLNQETIDKLPDNVSIRVLGDFGEENFKGFLQTDSALNTLKHVTYTKDELKEIMKTITIIEKGVNPNWDDLTKANYAYNYLQQNVHYDINPPGNADPARSKKYDGLAFLAMNKKVSTCQGFAHAYKELLTRQGIECYEIAGKLGKGSGGHAFNVVYIDEKPILVDTVKENQKAYKGYGFGVSDFVNYVFKSKKDLKEKLVPLATSGFTLKTNTMDTVRVVTQKNRYFDEKPLVAIGKDNPSALSTDESHYYRKTGESQVIDIVNSGFVRPKEGSINGGNKNMTYWSLGNDKLFYQDQCILEVPVEIAKTKEYGAISLDELSGIWMFDKEQNKYINRIEDIRTIRKNNPTISTQDELEKELSELENAEVDQEVEKLFNNILEDGVQLTDDRKSILKDQIKRYLLLGSNTDTNPQAVEYDKDGKMILHEGDLIHVSSINSLDSISEKGILTGQAFDIPEDGETFYCADFYRTPKDESLSTFVKNWFENYKSKLFSGNDSRGLSDNIMDAGISFVITSTEKNKELLSYDPYVHNGTNKENNEVTRQFVNTYGLLDIDNPSEYDPEYPQIGGYSSVLYGVPSSEISTVLIGKTWLVKDVEKEMQGEEKSYIDYATERINKIRNLSGIEDYTVEKFVKMIHEKFPNSNIASYDGTVLYDAVTKKFDDSIFDIADEDSDKIVITSNGVTQEYSRKELIKELEEEMQNTDVKTLIDGIKSVNAQEYIDYKASVFDVIYNSDSKIRNDVIATFIPLAIRNNDIDLLDKLRKELTQDEVDEIKVTLDSVGPNYSKLFDSYGINGLDQVSIEEKTKGKTVSDLIEETKDLSPDSAEYQRKLDETMAILETDSKEKVKIVSSVIPLLVQNNDGSYISMIKHRLSVDERMEVRQNLESVDNKSSKMFASIDSDKDFVDLLNNKIFGKKIIEDLGDYEYEDYDVSDIVRLHADNIQNLSVEGTKRYVDFIQKHLLKFFGGTDFDGNFQANVIPNVESLDISFFEDENYDILNGFLGLYKTNDGSYDKYGVKISANSIDLNAKNLASLDTEARAKYIYIIDHIIKQRKYVFDLDAVLEEHAKNLQGRSNEFTLNYLVYASEIGLFTKSIPDDVNLEFFNDQQFSKLNQLFSLSYKNNNDELVVLGQKKIKYLSESTIDNLYDIYESYDDSTQRKLTELLFDEVCCCDYDNIDSNLLNNLFQAHINNLSGLDKEATERYLSLVSNNTSYFINNPNICNLIDMELFKEPNYDQLKDVFFVKFRDKNGDYYIGYNFDLVSSETIQKHTELYHFLEDLDYPLCTKYLDLFEEKYNNYNFIKMTGEYEFIKYMPLDKDSLPLLDLAFNNDELIHYIFNGMKENIVSYFDEDVQEKVDKIKNTVLKLSFNQDTINSITSFLSSKIDVLDDQMIEDVINLTVRVKESNSLEMKQFTSQILDLAFNTEDPFDSIEKIVNVFEKNNLPTIGKLYKCFGLLQPNLNKFINNYTSIISPILQESGNLRKHSIIFNDLIKAAFGSNNRSVNNYLDNIEYGEKIFEKIKNNDFDISKLSTEELNELTTFRNHLMTMYENTYVGKYGDKKYVKSDNIQDDIIKLAEILSPNGTLDFNLGDRLVDMFCGFAGIKTEDQAKEYIKTKIETAEARNIEASQSKMILEQGDLVKGIGDITYLGDILQNGSVSKEYLGSSAKSDSTPLDTDLSMINTDGTIKEMIENTAAYGYGPIYFVLKNDSRFEATRTGDGRVDGANDSSKLELFYTGVLGNDHYGIRTGFASSEINYILIKGYDPRIGLEIAKNGFYIPVANMNGDIVFTYEDYQELRQKMSGLNYYGNSEYSISSNLLSDKVKETETRVKDSLEETNQNVQTISLQIKDALKNAGIEKVFDGYNSDLSGNAAEVYSTGSTSRGTNVPGDSDFDYLVKIDGEIYFDSNKLYDLKQEFKKTMGLSDGPNEKVVGKIKTETGQELDVEISFCPRTDKVEFSTDVALSEKLDSIKEQYPEFYEQILSNIVTAKEVLKKAGAYKSAKSGTGEGGLGGIGIENWILQHGGSFHDAAVSFLKVADECASFDEFKDRYQVYDLGENHYSNKTNAYPHENFVYEFYDGELKKMTPEGYEKMKNALREYLDGENLIEQKIEPKKEITTEKMESQKNFESSEIVEGAIGDTDNSISEMKDIELAIWEIRKECDCSRDEAIKKIERVIITGFYSFVPKKVKPILKQYSTEELKEIISELHNIDKVSQIDVENVLYSIDKHIEKYNISKENVIQIVKYVADTGDYSKITNYGYARGILQNFSPQKLNLIVQKIERNNYLQLLENNDYNDSFGKPQLDSVVSTRINIYKAKNSINNELDKIDIYKDSRYGVSQSILYELFTFQDLRTGITYSYREAKKLINNAIKNHEILPVFNKNVGNEYYKFKQKMAQRYGLNENDVAIIIESIDDVGACSYATICNEIFAAFMGNEEEFEKLFGFPMYVVINGERRLNAEELLFDLYLKANSTEFGGFFVIKDINGYKININALDVKVDPLGRRLLNTSQQSYLSTSGGKNILLINNYLNSKRLYFDSTILKQFDYSIDSYQMASMVDRVIDGMNSGKLYSLGIFSYGNPINFYAPKNSNYKSVSTSNWREGGGHSVFVTGVTEEGFIVSSWGKKYLISFSDLVNGGRWTLTEDTIGSNIYQNNYNNLYQQYDAFMERIVEGMFEPIENKTLQELSPILQDDNYCILGHGTGRSAVHVADSIFKEGLRTSHGSLVYTTVGLITNDLTKLEEQLNNWPHFDSDEIILIRLPKDYIYELTDNFDIGGLKYGAFYSQKNDDGADKNVINYIDSKFIIGAYYTKTKTIKMNDNFEEKLSDETIKTLKEKYDKIVLENEEKEKREEEMPFFGNKKVIINQNDDKINYNYDYDYSSIDDDKIEW